MLETTEVHSVAGLTSRNMPLMTKRPFRAPHHSISPPAMTGGTSNPRPGEVSLAHNGVLFLDEIPEFPRNVSESLRQPLEDGEVTISRASASVTYPCRFMLVCAMNPCKCGWHGHPSGKCTCPDGSVARYHERLSGPLLDRIDIYIEARSLEFDTLRGRARAESSAAIRGRVNKARASQIERYKDEPNAPRCNAYIDSKQIEKYCRLTDDCEKLMKSAFERLSMTARSYDRILRVARTIADLYGETDITTTHLSEAIQYRPVDFAKGL